MSLTKPVVMNGHQQIPENDEEESFIILGTSPTPSMEQSLGTMNSMSIIQHHTVTEQAEETEVGNKENEAPTSSINMANNSTSSPSSMNKNATAGVTQNQGHSSIIISKVTKLASSTPIPPSSMAGSMNASSNFSNSFASKFLLGEVDGNKMQSSIFQQFPSLNQASVQVDDVVKLYSLLDEHSQLKEHLEKTNVAMRRQFTVLQDWQETVKARMDEKNKIIGDLTEEISHLKESNTDLEVKLKESESKTNLATKESDELRKELQELTASFRSFQDSTTKEHADLRMFLSEKDALIQNISVENERLHLEKADFVVLKNNKPESSMSSAANFIKKEEHDLAIRDMNRKLSATVAANLQIKDMEKVYTDEIDCLKVNLTAAEELHTQMKMSLATLNTSNAENSKRAEEFSRQLKAAQDEIELLKVQVDVYQKDFNMEREARAKLVTDKENLLIDIKLLQIRNKQLIDDAQERLVNEAIKEKQAEAAASSSTTSSGAKKRSPSKSASPDFDPEPIRYICPICSTDMKTLRLLEQHIDICLKD